MHTFRARGKKLQTKFKVVEYRGGCVSKRSKVTMPLSITLHRQSSVSNEASKDYDSNSELDECNEFESGIDVTNVVNMDDQLKQIPQYGKQSLMKTRVRHYRKQKEAEVEAWSNIRENVLHKYIESMALADDISCNFCSNQAECRCHQCGILQLMCVDCCTKIHKHSLWYMCQRYGRYIHILHCTLDPIFR